MECLKEVFLFNSIWIGGLEKVSDKKNIVVEKNKKEIYIEVPLDNSVGEVEVYLYSSANDYIFEYSDKSPYAPTAKNAQTDVVFDADWAKMDETKRVANKNLYFPVVDIELTREMSALLELNKKEEGIVAINGNFHFEELPVQEKMNISYDILEYWDNAIYLNPNTNTIKQFGVREYVTIDNGKLTYKFNTLREDWCGKICVFSKDDERILLSEINIEKVDFVHNKNKKCQSEKEKILKSLSSTIKYILKCRNLNVDSPTYGGVFLLYDMTAKTRLRSDWPWTWGPAAILLLKASELDGLDVGMSKMELRKIAIDIALATLRQQIVEEGHSAFGITIATCEPDSTCKQGFKCRASTADSLYLAGWCWMPFYRATKDKRFLVATKNLAYAAARLMEQHEGNMIPQTYELKDNAWNGHMFFETSMGLIGLSELYIETKDERIGKILKDFITRLLDTFEREDGLWETWLHKGNDKISKCNYFTKSFGYCVEGLMAVSRAFPEEDYLMRAERIVEYILNAQFEDGSWAVRWDRTAEDVGIDDKGTALWAYLMLQLYQLTQKEKYKISGMKALRWCINNQYYGDDEVAQGGIVGRSWPSGIIYRYWFDVITTYTMAFFGNATIEALRIDEL